MRAAGGSGEGAGPFPWDEAIAFGLSRLRLPPDAFWALTPRELMLMAGAGSGAEPMDRATLAQLMARFD